MKRIFITLATAIALVGCNCNQECKTASQNESESSVLAIKEQGFFTAGGTVLKTDGTFDPIKGQYNPAGQTLHADYANIFYQVPQPYNNHRVYFLHGFGQSRVGWMNTPDGREGFAPMFLRKGYATYLIDQPRRGAAGQPSVEATVATPTLDQAWFTQFRMGYYPKLFSNSKFPQGEETLHKFFQQMTPNIGEFDIPKVTEALVATFEKGGDGIFITHSQGGIIGWNVAMQTPKVTAVVAIEPGTFPFPEGEVPTITKENTSFPVGGFGVPKEQFLTLTKRPIVIYFGDNIPDFDKTAELPAQNFWSGVRELAYKFAEVINANGGDCKVIDLPKAGISGNTHFMFQDLNNQEVFEHIYKWLESKKLAN